MPDCNEKRKGEGTTRLSQLSTILFVAAGLLMTALLVSLGVLDNIRVEKSRQDNGFTIVENSSPREVECADAPIGVLQEYTFTVSESLADDTYLAFYTVHQYADVRLDGELVYSLKPSEAYHITRTVGSNWVMIPLYREDAGKEICVEITPVYESFRNREVEFLIGSQHGIYVERLSRDLPQLILGGMAVFVGLVFLCLACYNLRKRQYGKRLASLGLFSIMIGLWRLADTRFTPFVISEKPILAFYVSITMLMLGIVPLVKFIQQRFHKMSCCVMDCYCIGTTGVCLVQLLLQFFGVMDIRDNLFVTHIVIAVGATLIVGNIIFERLRYPNREKNFVGTKLSLIFVVGVVADVIAFYIKGNSSGLIFSLLAFVMYIVLMGVSIMFHYTQQEKQLAEKDRQLAEQERQLTESSIATMMSQIQPHFIYNSLAAIRSLCVEDRSTAIEAIDRFSGYLRGSFETMDKQQCISFHKEMELVDNYLYLEQKRFEDKIRVERDLREKDFRIPPMSLQPIVENAVRHGIRRKRTAGTITIQSFADEKEYLVKVTDDGVGFHVGEPQNDGRAHVGLQNVEKRLQLMCGGKLKVESMPGQGTTVTIHIPRK